VFVCVMWRVTVAAAVTAAAGCGERPMAAWPTSQKVSLENVISHASLNFNYGC
jgi:hypothetical protein